MDALPRSKDEPDRDRTCDPLITYHLGFRRPRKRVRGLDYPFTVSLAGFRWAPSSLYAFPAIVGAWLGIAIARRRKGSPILTPVHPPVSGRGSHHLRVSCSTN